MTALFVGGLGAPFDPFVVAALRAEGIPAEALGPMDADAQEHGRAALPRGQCAPMLYTTGALIRAAKTQPGPVRALNVQSCGPCRYALFGAGWERALEREGLGPIELVGLEASLASLRTPGLRRAVEAVVAADALAETAHRLRPYELRRGAIDDAARAVAIAASERIAHGHSPLRVLAEARGWHTGLWCVSPTPLARAVLVGEPWSLHVVGDGRLHLPRVLAAAGVEVEVPPFGTWLAYLAWQARRDGAVPTVARFEAELAELYAAACDAAGIEGFAPPDVDALAALAAPHLDLAIRGGYGHVEVGLALAAAAERRAHVVISVKSFGCIPSAGISDAILPAALGETPYLSLEVCADGAAARESRLAMRVAHALDAADEELSATGTGFAPLAFDPLRPPRGPRRYASTLAEVTARG